MLDYLGLLDGDTDRNLIAYDAMSLDERRVLLAPIKEYLWESFYPPSAQALSWPG